MKKILLSIAAVLMCVLIFCGCEALSTNGAQSGAQASTGGEPSVSESAAEGEDLDWLRVTVTAHTNFELANGGFEPKITFVLPADTVIEGDGDGEKAVLPDGTILFVGWTFLCEKKEYGADDPLYYYENPEKSLGYVSHESVRCGEYDCLRIIEIAPGDKDDPESDARWREYFVDLGNGEIFSCNFLVRQNAGEETVALQEKIIAALER